LVYNKIWVYEGAFQDDRIKGIGRLKTDAGACEGFFESIFEFNGTLKINEYEYKGQFKYLKIVGKGILTYPNGATYEGQFAERLPQGEGLYKNKEETEVYEGSFNNGKKSGTGKQIEEKSTYEGGYLNGYKHGEGKITYSDGKVIKGVWKKGLLIKELH
jgi:hypothetical protein